MQSLDTFLRGTGIYQLFQQEDWWKTVAMFVLAGALVYLAIAKGFEPLLLLPIAIGMLLTNLPGAEIFHADWFVQKDINFGQVLHDGGFLDLLYLGVKLGIYPSLIFLGVGVFMIVKTVKARDEAKKNKNSKENDENYNRYA